MSPNATEVVISPLDLGEIDDKAGIAGVDVDKTADKLEKLALPGKYFHSYWSRK